MTPRLSLLNRQRRAIRSRMARDAKAYTAASAKMVAELEKLSKDELSEFLKKNPDTLLDIGGGIAAKVGSRVKAAAAAALNEWKGELKKQATHAAVKGKKHAASTREMLEDKALGYLKKALKI
ncbi:MAG: hypothetical protein Q8Q39_04625 [bacterium]|nr:hypothetical protein [bacterium]